jgi:hypothetical protein
LLKATASEINDYTNQTLDEVTTLGNTTANDISVGNVTLAGGGSDTQALQKQEITSLISDIDLTPYIDRTGDTMIGQLTLPGGGSNTQALQKQEITSLISAIPVPDLTPYVEKDGDNMSGNLTFNTNKIILNASSGSGTFKGALEAASIDGGTYAT